MKRIFSALLLCPVLLSLNFCVVRASSAALDPKNVVVVKNDVLVAEDKLKNEAAALLKAKNYAAIEKRAAQYRKSKAMNVAGYWHLATFYRGLSAVPKTASDSEWQNRVAAIEAWKKKTPNSITANVALIRVYYDGASRARGSGWASTVTPEMSRKMDERLRKAIAVLQSSAGKRRQCPGWYAAAQRVAILAGFPKAEYNKIVDEGVRLFPTYSDYHFERARYLLPRWYGSPGEWETYASKAANTVARQGGAVEGDILYARIIWSMQSLGMFRNIFDENNLSWPRAKKGYTALLKRNPRSFAVASGYAELASEANDAATAKTLFDKYLKNRVDLDVWSSKTWFAQRYNWAHGISAD